MTGDAGALLETAQTALAAGEWPAARTSFEAALEIDESAEALFGLGNALWWLGETEASVRHQERAYAEFRRRPDPPQAALAAIYLCLAYRASLGNHAASRGWLGRAARIVEESELTELSGWVLLCRAVAAIDCDDPRAAEHWAREARDAARAAGDADLELCALSELGTALVEMGRLDEGAALLDEAMAGSLSGESDSLDTVVMTSCNTIISCSRAGDFRRATQWIRAADDFNRRYGSPHLYTVCRTHYGGILFATGRWPEAESELRAALSVGPAAEPELHAAALAQLAEMQLAQGRLEEAERLVAGYEDHHAVGRVLATMRLAAGDARAAASLLGHCLREAGERCVERATLLDLLVEAEVALGELDEAGADARRLAALGGDLRSDLVVARGERALGRVAAARGGHGAPRQLEGAARTFSGLGMPLEAGRTRLLLAEVLAGSGSQAAVHEARAALSVFEELGAGLHADRAAALLRSLGVKAAREGPRGIGVLTKRELEILGLLEEGLSNREMAERLFLSRKTVEHHVASVLSKLGLKSRAEAAAYAVRHLARGSAAK